MFETAIISSVPARQRLWGACAGATGQAFALAVLAVIYVWFPAALPQPQSILAWLTAPPSPRQAASAATTPMVAAPKTPFQFNGSRLVQPAIIPSAVAQIEDPPIPPGVWIASAFDISRGIGAMAAEILAPAAAPAPAMTKTPAPAPPVKLEPRRVGGDIKPAEVLSRVQPVYPPLAQRLRVSGVVEVEGTIGLDGRIHDLHVKNGNPLLVPAAMDAVNKWVFRPTTLNGEPVEVIQTVIVNFILK